MTPETSCDSLGYLLRHGAWITWAVREQLGYARFLYAGREAAVVP